MYADLTSEFLEGAAASDEPAIRRVMGDYEVTVYVRRLENWELAAVYRQTEPPDPEEAMSHPLARPLIHRTSDRVQRRTG